MIVSVLYPADPGKRFDMNYYTHRHIPLVKSLWEPLGLKKIELLRCVGAPSGGGTYQLIALLTFGSLDEFQKAAAQHGNEVLGDIPKFTDVEPVMQFNEMLR